jgi:acetate kinase
MEIINLLKKAPVFDKVSAESLNLMAEKAELREFSGGEKIIPFGVEGRHFGVVVAGEVEASRSLAGGGTDAFKILRPGEYFGEMSLMTGEPTTADIVALGKTRVILVPHDALAPVLAREPALTAELARTISRRLLDRERNLRDQKDLEAARRAQDDPYDLDRYSLPGGGRFLTLNCGSSSLKYRILRGSPPEDGLRGTVERIGLDGTLHRGTMGGESFEEPVSGEGFPAAFEAMERAIEKAGGIGAVRAVGHRVVHGGAEYNHAVLITDEVLSAVEALVPLAPLHLPANLAGIRIAQRLLPSVPHVAVFDTSFHTTVPAPAYVYGIPEQIAHAEGIRRYGFHGTSHKYVSLRAATFLKRPFNGLKLVTCHLGNGASVAAVDHGRCIDTSMGLTPLEGLIMGTRSGDLDPGALLHLMRVRGLSVDEMDRILQKESGLLGLSGVSSDMRQVLSAATGGNERALLAVQAFCYRVKKYIGAYWAALGGIDALVFTGGIGENSPEIRARVCQGLGGVGVRLDEEANRAAGRTASEASVISLADSSVEVLVVPTDEERMIARESARAVSRDDVTRIMQQSERFIPVGVSAHHVHLARAEVEALFGPGHELTIHAPLTQPGQFACKEKVTLVGPKGRVERVRVLGPERKETQVEISRTEEFKLGIDAPVRMSGDLDGTPGLVLEGPAGRSDLAQGVICARRHIHMTPEDALHFGIRDRDVVLVEIEGERSLIFGDVTVRVNPDFRLELHLDTDEANAAEVETGTRGSFHSIQSRRAQ